MANWLPPKIVNETLLIAASSKPNKVAGAIAHRVRENNYPIILRAVGKNAIVKAVYSIGLASVYLGLELNNNIKQVECTIEDKPMKAYEFEIWHNKAGY